MKTFMATSLALVASVNAFNVHNHHHQHHSSTPQLRLAFPPIHQRDPHKCEVYERAEAMEDGGCHMQCVLSGNLGGVTFSDSVKRKPQGLCMPVGHSCQIPIEMQAHYNTTSGIGKCTNSCKCVPVSRKELEERQRNAMFGYGYPYMHNLNQRREIKSYSELRKLPFEISFPYKDHRNSEKCERFEQQTWFWPSQDLPANPDDQCKLSCVVQGHFGNVNLKLPERPLNKNKPEGTRCYLKVAETEDIVSYGIKQSVNGKCVRGTCVAEGVRVMHFTHPTPAASTESSKNANNNHAVDSEDDYDRED